MNRIELLERFLYFIEYEIYLDINNDKKVDYGKLFLNLRNDPIYIDFKNNSFNNLKNDNDILAELKSKIRELKLQKIMEQI